MLVRSILSRLEAMERELPQKVLVTLPGGKQSAVAALTAFQMAVCDKGVTFSAPRKSAHGAPSASRGGCCHR